MTIQTVTDAIRCLVGSLATAHVANSDSLCSVRIRDSRDRGCAVWWAVWRLPSREF